MLELWKSQIESRLRELLKPFEPRILYDAMSYYVFQEGKRIRPLFLCAVSDALGGNVQDAITVGCAIEFIHNYSLVHDDLPALDNDDFRRGKPSCHVLFGEDMAILAGDALLNLAFETLSNRENFISLSEKDLIYIIRLVSESSGFQGMVGGQVMDVKKLGDPWSISLKKTASMFSAVFACGGIISKKHELVEYLSKAGTQVGLLFQLIDDYKDKDGFYLLYGDDITRLVEEKHAECINMLESMGILTPFISSLIRAVISPLETV
ncbi:polyprenyl synthetase family protein [Hydrogenobacter thermophilus]|uniref:polyprenyl synthetase family protein n=1 Tax=Hydrogenobacter thermophilus TaxID=940 RepID=UPI0030F86CAD